MNPGFRLALWRELKRLRRRRAMLLPILLCPILLGGILMSLFSFGILTELPIAIVDQDRSKLSRQIIQTVDAVPDVAVKYRLEDIQAANALLLSRDIYGFIVLPKNFERDLLALRKPELTLFYTNQWMTAGGVVSQGVKGAIDAILEQQQRLVRISMGEPLSLTQPGMSALSVEVKALFNPTRNYRYSLLNGLWPTVLQIVICLSAVYVTWLEPISVKNRIRLGGGVMSSLFGKLLPYFALFMLIALLADTLLFIGLGLPLNGSLLLLLIGTALFVSGYLLYGTVLALVGRSMIQSLTVAGVLTGPAFGFTGIAYPRLVMNTFATAWGSILPVTWYLELRVDQTLRGVPWMLSFKPLGYLLLINTSLLLISLLLMRRAKGGGRDDKKLR